MLDHLGIIALMALVATGAYEVQQDGMILQRLGKFWSFLPSFWQKPLWTCAVCMCSVFGIPIWVALTGVHIEAAILPQWAWNVSGPLVWYPVFHGTAQWFFTDLFAAAGLAAYLNR